MKYYPVIIPTLNRYNHLRNCIESLANCKGAEYTELVIGLDYPPAHKYFEGYNKIKAYLPTIQGFQKVTIIEHKENVGSTANFLALAKYVYEKYDAVITSEDDNIFSPTFLEFINSGLNIFESDSNISSICGYTPPFLYNSDCDAILTYDSSAWGVGLWRDKDLKKPRSKEFAKEILFSWRKSFSIFEHYPCLLSMLQQMIENNEIFGDALRTSYNILDNTYQLKPSVSIVRNMGHDGSGLHSGLSSDIDFDNQELSTLSSYILSKNSIIKKAPKGSLLFYGLPTNRLIAIKGIIGIAVKYLLFRIKNRKN